MKINYRDNEEFYSLPFYVDHRVLIPRNDTEILVEKVLKHLKNEPKSETILIDVGTGSSAIMTAVVKNSPISFVQVLWLDISSDALEVAKVNVEKNNIQNQITLFHSDLLGAILSRNIFLQPAKNIIITANLPYIKNGDFENMDKEVLENEPHLALFGWENTGFEMYEKLISQTRELEKLYSVNTTLFIEIWFDQYEYSKEYLSSQWLKFEYFKDLNNIYRVIKIDFN